MKSKIQCLIQTVTLRVKRFFAWMHFMLGIGPSARQSATAELSATPQKNYFVLARSWADDMYTSAIISRNRYRLAFFMAMALSCLLTIAVDSLIPLQHMQPLLVNHYQDGRVSVVPMKQPYAPTNQAQMESEIVRYVINRESYDPSSYDAQYSLINLMSDSDVAKQYINEQSTSNKSAPINLIGNKGFRTVHVDSVIFLDSTPAHQHLAQVNFIITDHFKNSVFKKIKALTALISWDYRGTPNDPEEKWRDWDGFIVTRYTLVQRNV